MEQQATWPGWETVRLIGRGSFGAVYEIQRNVFDDVEKAALKVISIPQNASDIDEMYSDGYDEESITSTFQSHLKSIAAEYSLMRKMNGSANIVNCDDIRYIQHEDGIGWDIFIKMELLTPLSKALPADVSEEMVIKIAKDMCTALELCKKHGIVHRDIKPQNIFVSDNGDYKLGDFGIAKTVEKTMGGTKIGTYKYMAPEVYNNQPYGSGADIYSLGLVLYWLLNERRMPFLPLPPAKLSAGMEEAARHRRFSGEDIPEPKNGSERLKAIVLKACAFDPKQRYSSASQMLEELDALKGRVPVSMPEPIPASITEPPTPDPIPQPVPAPAPKPEPKPKPTPEPKPVPKPKKQSGKKKWPIVIAGVLLVIMILLCLRFCGGDRGKLESPMDGEMSTDIHSTSLPKIAVRNVVGKTEDEAKATLEELGFVVVIQYEKAEAVEEGKVISQSEDAGTKLELGSEILLKVSSGKPAVAVADVVGKTEAEAKATLEGQGFKVTVTEKNSDSVAEGKVIGQSVEAGTQLVIGSEIQLTVSSGKKAISVADVVGKTQAQAKSVLEDQGFKVNITKQNSDTVDAGKVISQSPAAGSKQQAGSTITLVISKGPATITVSFNANGGKVSTASMAVNKAETYGKLPTPTRDYYNFDGWYTEPNGGKLVTSETTVTASGNHTLYARWTLKPLSGWVLASQAPAGAQIVDQKWTYLQASYTTSSSSTLSGWTLYDTTSEWGSYGAWSSWSTTAVTETDSRDVETKSEVTGYNMVTYNTMSTGGARQFRSFSIKGQYSKYGCSSSYGEFTYSTTASVSTINSAKKVASGAYTKDCTYPGYNKDSKTGYILKYGSKTYVFFISSNINTTYYRYRERSMVYTYYFYKVEEKESTTEVTTTNTISNVQKWVRYRPK